MQEIKKNFSKYECSESVKQMQIEQAFWVH